MLKNIIQKEIIEYIQYYPIGHISLNPSKSAQKEKFYSF